MTKYGYSTMGVVFALCFILILAGIWTANPILKYSLFVFSGLLTIFTLNFFRDPERITPADKNVIVSPADGKIIIVKEVEEPNFIKGKATQISVFMSPLNVHVNRIPVDGQVNYVKYHKGQYIAAFEDKASEVNERSEIAIDSKLGKVLFTQVAGFVARRIVYDLKGGEQVTMGNRFGMIKFGSRVDVWVGEGFTTEVKVGDIVRAGETVLYKAEKPVR